MSMSVEKWLGLPDDKLAVELGKVFTREDECRHDWVDVILRMPGLCNLKYKCTRCALHVAVKTDFGCVPDPINLDWNTAMEWFRFKADRNRVEQSITAIWEACVEINVIGYQWWLKYYAQPKHYLIAAAMAVEGAKHETM